MDSWWDSPQMGFQRFGPSVCIAEKQGWLGNTARQRGEWNLLGRHRHPNDRGPVAGCSSTPGITSIPVLISSG